MDASISVPTKYSPRRRLKQQARDILEDYWRVSQHPSSTDKEALLEKIKAVPECAYYDMIQLSAWFANRRQQLRVKARKEQALASTNNDSRFPSLTIAAIQHLTVLANNHLHPSSELLKTWASLLASSGAKEQDVINWIHYRIQEQQLQHLPTPSDTTNMTPEPSASATPVSPTSQNTFPPFKQETRSPVMPLRLHSTTTKREAPASPSEPSPTSPTSKNDLMSLLNRCIIPGVRDALASPTMPNPTTPKTAAEFEAMFSPFEQQILLLLRTLET